MKRILMFGWEYPPEVSGGLGIATHGLLIGLAKQGAKIKFVLPTYKKKLPKKPWKIINASDITLNTGEIIKEEFWEKITYVEVGAMLLPYISQEDYRQLEKRRVTGVTRNVKVLRENYKFKGGYGDTLLKEVTRLALIGAELGTKKDFDVIHAHDWMTYPAALAAGARSGKPVVLHVHSTEIERSFPQIGQDIYDLERHSLENADHVITVSRLTRDILAEQYGLNRKKISVVHNSFSPEFTNSGVKRKFPSKNPTVVFLGRMARQKAPSLFVDIAKTLSDRNGDYRFVMAGDGYLLEDIRKKVETMNLSNKFSFPGFLTATEVKKLFNRSDIFVLPASSEPFGMVALEAATSGLPVILSNQTGAKEVMPSVRTFECWETFRIANAIENLIKNPKEALEYAGVLRKEAKRRTWEKAGKETMKIYNGLSW